MKPRLSFQSRVLLGCLVVVLCTIMMVGVLAERWWRDQLVSRVKQSLNHELILLADIVGKRYHADESLAQSDLLAKGLGKILPNTRVTLIAPDGKVLGDSQVPASQVASLENHKARPEVIESLKHGQGMSIRYSSTLDTDLFYAARLIDGSDGPRLIIRAALPLSDVEKLLAQTRTRILWAVLLGIALSVVAAYLVSRTISRPVKELTETAGAIASGDASRRFFHYPSNEIGELGRAFDRMADKLQSQIEDVTKGRDRLEAVLRGMVEGVLLIDQTGRVLLANEALRGLLEITDPVGRHVSEAIRNPELLQALKEAREGELHISREITTQTLPARFLEIEVVRLPGQDSRVEVVAVLHDITQRKHAEQMRKDFVANVSHELRTPLTAIRGSAETLADGAAQNPKHAQHFLEMIIRQTTRLEQLASDLLDLAHLESGRKQPEMEEVDAVELGKNVLSAVSELASSRGVELKRDLPAKPVMFSGDRRQLEQALSNLLDNALKYTPQGGHVTLYVKDAGEEIHFLVRDTGIGIAKEHLPRIFERFYRVDRNRSREMGGTGLGLAIVKHVAQSHKGRVEVNSKPGEGSVFCLMLPK